MSEFMQALILHAETVSGAACIGIATIAYVVRVPPEFRRKLWWSLALGMVAVHGYELWSQLARQYAVWSADDFGKLHLPPNAPISFFGMYALKRYGLERIFLVALSLGHGLVAWLLQKGSDELFEGDEAALTILLTLTLPPRAAVFFLPALIIVLMVVMIAAKIFARREQIALGPALLATTLLLMLFADPLLARLAG